MQPRKKADLAKNRRIMANEAKTIKQKETFIFYFTATLIFASVLAGVKEMQNLSQKMETFFTLTDKPGSHVLMDNKLYK